MRRGGRPGRGGWHDSHRDLTVEERSTSVHSGLILDLLMATADAFSDPGICPQATCENLSDHLPVWATLHLKSR